MNTGSHPAEAKPQPTQPSKFGTIGGVVTSSTLTILGVTIFLCFGEIVGQAGIASGLIILLALSGGAWMRNHLAQYGDWSAAGNGVLSFDQMISDDVEDPLERRVQKEF
ncbi:MAG: hypothetical protein ACI8XO_001343 [Verrucomicrobiales bacterium]|jgi:hypothetical protein